MKAVILCGGTGSRLRPLTEVRPKPLIKLMNVPVLEMIINKLGEAGIKEIYLSLGFMAQEMIRACENINTDCTLRYCEEAKPLGTAGGVKYCIDSSEEDLLVVSGDNIFTVDINAAAKFHKNNAADFTVIGKKVADPREYGCIVKNESDDILSFIEKPSWENTDSFLINTGMYIVSPDILSLIPPDTFCDFAENIFPMLFERHKKFVCYETDAFWGDMGEFEMYTSLSAEILQKYTESFPFKGRLILRDENDEKGNSLLAPCLIGEHTVFGKNSRIGPCTVVGAGTLIGSDCNIENSVVGDNCMIGDGTDIIGAITDDNVTVGANCVAEKNSVIGYGADIGKFSRLLSGVKIWPGKTIPSESVINKDMFYETPVSLEFDIFGISGKMYSQFTLSDAVKIGQALASLKGIKRIGISCDGKNPSAVYRELLCTGVLSCGAACYDFEESYMAQAYFYSAYCGLDAFIFISANDDIINLSFFGKNGMPVSAGTARMINNNYRFSAFSFSGPDNTGILYRMAPLSTAYSCGLQKQMQVSEAAFNISVECENENVKRSLEAFFADKKPEGSEKLIQFLFNPTGTEMYCLENERFYSSDRIRSVLCELEFAEGHDVIIPENASESIEKTAVKYGRKAFRVYEGATEEYDFNKQDILENLWNFDAVFLCVKLMNLLTASGSTLEELMNMQNDFSVRSKIIELDCSPSSIRNKIVSSLRVNKNPGDIYFSVPSSKGDIKLRQMGNTSRIRMIVEAADMETAKELMTDVSGKFAGGR